MPAVSGDCDFSFSLSWNVASSEMPSWTALFDSRPCPAPSGFSFSQSASGPQVLSRQDQLRWCCELPRGQGLAGFFSGTSPVLRMLRGPQHVPSESLGCRGMVRVHGASFHGCPGARGCSDLPALQLAGGALGGGPAGVPRSTEVGSQPHCRLLPRSPWHQGSADRPCELWVRMPTRLGVGSSDTLVA